MLKKLPRLSNEPLGEVVIDTGIGNDTTYGSRIIRVNLDWYNLELVETEPLNLGLLGTSPPTYIGRVLSLFIKDDFALRVKPNLYSIILPGKYKNINSLEELKVLCDLQSLS